MLYARTLIADTKGSSTFKVVQDYFEEKEVSLTNLSACATDSVPAMSGRHVGSRAHLKKAVPEVITVSFIVNT